MTSSRSLVTSILCIIFLLASATANAMTSFTISSEIFRDGQLIASPRIIAKPNQKATIYLADKIESTNHQIINMSGLSLKLRLIASKFSSQSENEAIKIKYDIWYKNGIEVMHAHPQIIVFPNQKGSISFKSASNHVYEIRVIAQRE